MNINQLIINVFKRLFRRPEVTLPILSIIFGLWMFWIGAEQADYLATGLALAVVSYLFYLKDNPDPKVVHVLNTYKHFILPEYKTPGASGLDVYYAEDDIITVPPGQRALIPTGLFVSLPDGYEFQVRPRSGLANNFGITVLNSPGTIDSDYRGEIKVILHNTTKAPFSIQKKDRICQLVLAKVEKVEWKIVQPENYSITDRGEGGFGHTG